MKKDSINTARVLLPVTIIVAIFIIVTYLARRYAGPINNYVEQRAVLGVIIFFVIDVLDALIAPGSTLSIVPIAARIWGIIPAALITIVGWTLGSLFAFSLARRFGKPLVKYFVPIKYLEIFRKAVPKKLFWGIVFARIVFPLDIISYVLGLFTRIPVRRYALATVIGVAPAALTLSYIHTLPPVYEIIAFLIGVVLVILASRFFLKRAGVI